MYQILRTLGGGGGGGRGGGGGGLISFSKFLKLSEVPILIWKFSWNRGTIVRIEIPCHMTQLASGVLLKM